ncbi:calcium-binding protein [Albimonas pacifica]|uniref:Hemolysin-type calcium-binding repeat-containing protein n=1 Tax=Albimonas pacifica TaxID=1114924 RepID=A0A1I3GRG7_9RHOB|nr:calcium-binding protein [Albimonas pacifica]SFI25979.1 Hemolysin-type calcium-binding repeat-containing protein [Albimonas pacifica]
MGKGRTVLTVTEAGRALGTPTLSLIVALAKGGVKSTDVTPQGDGTGLLVLYSDRLRMDVRVELKANGKPGDIVDLALRDRFAVKTFAIMENVQADYGAVRKAVKRLEYVLEGREPTIDDAVRLIALLRLPMNVDGTDGYDVLVTGRGGGVLRAGGGNDDVFFTGPGRIDGGAGTDTLDLKFFRALYGRRAEVDIDLKKGVMTLPGGKTVKLASLERVEGEGERDVIRGAGRAETFEGGGGRDALVGRGGADALFGEGGADRIFGGSGADLLVGGAGGDLIKGASGDDRIDGQDGDDDLHGGGGGDQVLGGAGRDRLFGDGGADTLDGGEGADTLFGGDGDDTLTGHAGDDVLVGGAGSDVMVGDDAGIFGADEFRLDGAGDAVDRVLDFRAGEDAWGVAGLTLDDLEIVAVTGGFAVELAADGTRIAEFRSSADLGSVQELEDGFILI